MTWPWKRKRSDGPATAQAADLDRRQQELLGRLPVAERTEVLGEVPLTLEAKRRQVDDLTARLDAMVEQLNRRTLGSA